MNSDDSLQTTGVDPAIDPRAETTDLLAASQAGGERVKTRVPEGDFDLEGFDLEELGKRTGVVERLLGGAARKSTATRKYDVQDEVGRGGMGKILRVRDTDLNRSVAMKVLLAEDGKKPGVRRFIEEAQVTGQLEHPNVLPVHDFGVDPDGGLFFTMQYVPGHTTLRTVVDRLADGDPSAFEEFTWERRVQIVQQVCHALHYAHSRGVVHRDVKPDNILLGSCGEVYLVDWGVARILDERAEADAGGPMPVETLSREEAQRTQRGAWIGTPIYMAPEQIMGMSDQIAPQTDTYALSAVLYEFLTLKHYLGETGTLLNELVSAVVQRRPKDAESFLGPFNGRVPRHLSRICRKGLAKRRKERFQTALELHQALQYWVEGRAPIVCPGTFIQHWLARWSSWIDRHPTAVPALSLSLIGLVLAAAILGMILAVRALSR